MKTGRKISLIYSGITIGLIIIAGVVFYFFASNYVHNLYFHYLEEKAHAVAEEKFSKDELDPVKYQNVVLRRKNSIPTSQELFIRVDDRTEGRRALHEYFSDQQINRLYHNETVDFSRYDESGTAFVYYDNTGTFAVIVLSKNPYVEAISRSIRWMLVVLVLVAAGVLWLISKLYAMRVLDRIDKDYQTEKMFVNNASHEINNPLTAIQGECEVALIGEHSREDYQDALRRISHETDRIITIMRELLMFSHAKYGDTPAMPSEPVKVSELFAQLPAQVRVMVKADFMLQADKDLLNIAVHNLVSNALKYAEGKPVEVIIDKPHIHIVDHGIGIPSDDLPHVFEPFFRASNTRSITGRGVGLALSKAIIEKMGGKISVRSTEGEGTTLDIKI
ncbi:MAG: HAMP domain-containing sensor histidine kinase [Prevotella sp.]|nr:HAMP domain-containing sensor histidine kinase [Prevotella sp.]